MATNFSPCKGSYVLNQFPSNVMFGMNGFHVSASGAIQGHHGPLVLNAFILRIIKILILSKTSPGFLRVCGTSLLKILQEKEKSLVTSIFSFSHSVFLPFEELSYNFIKSEIAICKLF